MLKKKFAFKQDDYRSRGGRVSYLHKPDTIYARSWLSNLAVLTFVFVDLFCLKVVWNTVQFEDWRYIWCTAFACAVALDVPLAICGVIVKKYHQGLCDSKEKNIILVLSVAVFVVAFIFSFAFRFCTRDISFQLEATSNLVNSVESVASGEKEDNPIIIVSALFAGVIPLLTSISSYVISYFGYDPLRIKNFKLETERVGLQSNILEAERTLAQAETSAEYCRSLLARENDMYHTFQDELLADGVELKQLIRILIMEKQKTPEAVTEIARNGEELIKSHQMGIAPERELLNYIYNQTEARNTNIVTDFTEHVALHSAESSGLRCVSEQTQCRS